MEYLGPILVIGFVVILVICIIVDKTANKRFLKKIDAKYKPKDSLGGLIITENNEVLLNLPSGTLAGFKLWALEDIAYVGTSEINRTNLTFSFLDENKKAMKGKYLTPSHKPVLQKGMKAFVPASYNQLDEIYEFIRKYKPDVQKIRNGTVEE